MAFVDDDEVEELGRNCGIVCHVRRLAAPRPGRIEGGAFFVAGIVVGLALQHRIEPLDGGDDHLGGGVDRVRVEALDGIELGELARVVRWLEVCELVIRLPAEVRAVHQEQDAAGPAVLQQTIDDVDGGEGLAGAGRHLNQGARVGMGERPFEVADRAGLDRPQTGLVQHRQLSQPGTQGVRLCHPPRQRLGPREIEDLTAARRRVRPVCEAGHRPVGLEQEWQRVFLDRETVRHAVRVLCRLRLDPSKRAFRLGLYGTDGDAVDVEQVVGETEARLHGELGDRDAEAGAEVHVHTALDQPAGHPEVRVDDAPCALFWRIRHVAPAAGFRSCSFQPCLVRSRSLPAGSAPAGAPVSAPRGRRRGSR